MIAFATTLHDDDQQNQTNTAIPTLWVDDVLSGRHLYDLFRVMQYSPGETLKIEPGSDHYILHTSFTPEALTKALAWSILAAGASCRVHGINNTLENLVGDKSAARELTIQIFQFSRPYEEWAIWNDETKLTLKQAALIARVAIALLPESSKLVELSILRERCNLSSYEWSKLVKSLETKFQEELDRRLGKSPAEKQATEKSERLKLEIQALLLETDLVLRTLKRSSICSKFSISGKDLDLLISGLNAANNTPLAREYNAVEFRALEPEGITWAIPGLLPSCGVTVFAGPAGVGKSTLAYDAAAAILFGDEFLGETPTNKGKVLFVASDEPQPFVEDKFINRGIYGSDDYSIILDWEMSQISKLEQSIERLRPTLVIVDSFSAIHKDPSFDENSAQARRSVEQLQALANRYNTAILLIHHTTKSKDQSGVGKVRGSTSIVAAGSLTWILEGESNSSVRTFTTPKIRGAAPWNVRLTLDAHNGRWEIVGGNEEEGTHKTIGSRIVEFMLTNPEALFEVEEIVNAVGYGKQSVYKALDRLVQRGVLIKRPSQSDTRRKVYKLVDSLSNPPLPTTPLNVDNKIAEPTTVQELEFSRQILDNCSPDSRQPVEVVPIKLSEPIDVPELQPIVDNDHSLEGEGSKNLVEQQPHTNETVSLTSHDGCDEQEALIGSAQLISEAISQMDGQVIEALALHWDDDFKQAVLERFCLSDKKAVQTVAPGVLETKIKPEDLPVPLFDAPDLVVGDEVSVLNYPKFKGLSVTISTITTTGIWVRVKGARAPHGPFQPNHLRKC